MATATDRRFLTIDEAAELLRVSRRTVERLIADGAFTTKKVRGRRRILKASFDRWQSSLPE